MSLVVLFSFNNAYFLLLVVCVYSLLACASHCDFSMCCHAWESFLLSSTDCNQCIFIASQLATDNAFLVHNLLYHYCISGVLIMMSFCDMCSGAFICLVLLVNGFPSLPFFIHGFSFTYQHQTDIKKTLISDQHWSPPGSIIMACQ
jgi:hypothetical protein